MEVIGGGGMANVYLARDMILERDVAIKILRFDFVNDEEFIKRFRREAQSATSLAHPNIVSIYDVGEEEDIYYIVMEYVDGQTLKQYIQKNAPLHPREALNIMEQIVSAIAHAHENQIVHRDIKPHNILIDHHGNVKVTDFGIAMALTSTTITHTNSVLGSVHYLSPEQARGGLATKKSDIYSLGIVLYELIAGRLPFDGESAVSIALKHLQSEAPSPKRWNPAIPQSVENIILKAMAKDPLHRYNSVEEMEEDIKTAFHSSRRNEARFMIPDDEEEMTKAIPIIQDHMISESGEDTVVHQPNTAHVKKTAVKNAEGKKKKRKKFWTGLIITFILLAVAAVMAFTLLPSLLLPKDIEVPDVTNMKYEEAVTKLVSEGFEVDEPIIQSSEEIEEGYVIKTSPSAGKVVKEGAKITIYQSSGKEKVEFDSYIGEDIDRISDLLERKGFTSISVTEEYSDEDQGIILSQDPKQGEEVIPGETTIEFVVSKGPKKEPLIDLSGYTRQAVVDYMNEQQFKLNVKEDHSEDVPEGEVISQSPKPGTELLKGDTVDVTFSLGPEKKPDKKVSVEVEIPYETTEENEQKPVDVGIYVSDAKHSLDKPYQKFKIKEPTTRTIELTISAGESAYFQVLVDNKVVHTETVAYPED